MLVSFCVVDCSLLFLFPHISIKVFTQFKKQKHAQKTHNHQLPQPNRKPPPLRFYFGIHLLTLYFLGSLTLFYRTDITEYVIAKE